MLPFSPRDDGGRFVLQLTQWYNSSYPPSVLGAAATTMQRAKRAAKPRPASPDPAPDDPTAATPAPTAPDDPEADATSSAVDVALDVEAGVVEEPAPEGDPDG